MTRRTRERGTGVRRRTGGGPSRALALGLLLACASAGLSGMPIVGPPGQARITAGQLAALLPAGIQAVGKTLAAAEGRELTALYEALGGRPAWVTVDGNPGPGVLPAIHLLTDAAREGLVAADYGVADLTNRLAAFPVGTPDRAVAFDVRLSAAVLRYYRHVHLGRVDPGPLGLAFGLPPDTHRFSDHLRTALDRRQVVETARALAPPYRQYDLLRDALARYRLWASSSSRSLVFPTTVRPGDVYDDLAVLHERLVTIGDLGPGTPLPDGNRYDETIAAGVRRFQARHGLDEDAVIGRATAAALAVPLARRARQIELALERLRWLPDLSGGRVIVVNIPMFRLWAWNHLPTTDAPALSMKVVVGRALDTRTPLVADQMEHVIFRPYWNVPTSILRGEMLPVIARDPEYLSRQNLEIVDGPGDNAPVLAATAGNIARLGRGNVRLRQRPGPGNALGLIKFIFPNDHDVYMHDTPSTQLFARSRRDFSHGCIRVEDPVGLATWALADLPGWSRDAVVAAMNGAPNHRIDLPEPIQVVMLYTTTAVDPADRTVHFADDIYGHDARLLRVF